MSRKIDDDFLYQHMPEAEEKWIDTIDQAAKITPSYSARFRRKVRQLTKDSKRTRASRIRIHAMRQAAAVLAIIILTAFIGCMSVEATRVKFFELIKKIEKEYTDYMYDSKDGSISEDDFVFIEPTYIPEGYKEYERDEEFAYIEYRDKENKEETRITYEEMLADGLTVSLDTEGATVKKDIIAGTSVEYFENKGISFVYWTDENTYYELLGYNLKMSEVKKIAKSIITSDKYIEKNN